MTTTRRLSLAYLALTAGVAVLFALNAKYIHSNLAVYCLKAYAEKYGDTSDEISIGEYTINQQVDDILMSLYQKHPDILCFSCYIWNIVYVKELIHDLKKVLPQVRIWMGGPEASYDAVHLMDKNSG